MNKVETSPESIETLKQVHARELKMLREKIQESDIDKKKIIENLEMEKCQLMSKAKELEMNSYQTKEVFQAAEEKLQNKIIVLTEKQIELEILLHEKHAKLQEKDATIEKLHDRLLTVKEDILGGQCTSYNVKLNLYDKDGLHISINEGTRVLAGNLKKTLHFVLNGKWPSYKKNNKVPTNNTISNKNYQNHGFYDGYSKDQMNKHDMTNNMLTTDLEDGNRYCKLNDPDFCENINSDIICLLETKADKEDNRCLKGYTLLKKVARPRKGKTIIMGDLNAHIYENDLDFILSDHVKSLQDILPNSYLADNVHYRRYCTKKNTKTDEYGKRVLELCISSRSRILNARTFGDTLGKDRVPQRNGMDEATEDLTDIFHNILDKLRSHLNLPKGNRFKSKKT
ncbi:Hypothetical predicted protein [Mytilus galloprovincialis]|uniref:Endonuclease/exonuclease/phosphatase domain-containing protein n=1 Tax=Mytilus galloprovincialis TaxID=29158 RepID=A0A8B6DE77_MYTGA|nr:Hypothetical predicted protein [Mytilus galloprovincialis]